MADPEIQTPEDENPDFGLPAQLFDDVLDAVDAQDAAAVEALFEPLHAADIADLLEQITQRDRKALLSLWKGGMDGDILSELDDNLREEIINSLNPTELATAVGGLESDDVVDLIEDLEDDQQEAVLTALGDADRAVVEKALAYPEYSAGRLMQIEVARAPEHWSVGEAIDYLRSDVSLPEQFYHLILIDPRAKPRGYVTLGRLLSSRRTTKLRDISEPSFRTFSVSDDQGAIAYAFNQ